VLTAGVVLGSVLAGCGSSPGDTSGTAETTGDTTDPTTDRETTDVTDTDTTDEETTVDDGEATTGSQHAEPTEPPTTDGYRGIWFRLGQIDGEYGDKYAGGLGTYTMKHVPVAVHAPTVGRTFFTYGATKPDRQDLEIAVSYYDHETGTVPRPRIVDHKDETDSLNDTDVVIDPHDNASIALDGDGRVWVFVSGRGSSRPGRIYRSVDPYDVERFERLTEREMAYPQPWYFDDGFCYLFTKYTDGRELYWQTTDAAGDEWSAVGKLAGFGGHYQISERHGDRVVTAFNRHPGGDVDRRTDLYALQTSDRGETWGTLAGETVSPPLASAENPALVEAYSDADRLVYVKDITVDAGGNPAVLHLTSGGHRPGPESGPRRWRIAHWDGTAWCLRDVATSDHNYDAGSLYVRDGEWTVVAPTGEGPQPYHTGGRIAAWTSTDRGRNWERRHTYPTQDGLNATYARRPRAATAPFDVLWADGDAHEFSDSRLYVASLDGGCWQLPFEMDGERAEPRQVQAPGE